MDMSVRRAAKAGPCQRTAQASVQPRHVPNRRSALLDGNTTREIQAALCKSDDFRRNSNRQIRGRAWRAWRIVSSQTRSAKRYGGGSAPLPQPTGNRKCFAQPSRAGKVACDSATMRQKSDEQRRARPAGARRDSKLVSRTMEEQV